jgi:negative regulator of sigma E activity
MSREPIMDRLSAYLDDELSREERMELESELHRSASLKDRLERLRKVRDWLREYPGRKPDAAVWPKIAARVTEPEWKERSAQYEDRAARRGRVPGGLFLAALGWTGAASVAKRVAIMALVAVTLGGIGRQLVLERRARSLEHSSALRDVQLLRYANAAKWQADAVGTRDRVGRRFSIACPPNGQLGSVWGTGIYTDDSSICTAAVHSGAITREAGGIVSFEIQDGLAAYRGSEQNGVASHNYGDWPGSFVIVPEARMPGHTTELDGGTITWDASALDLRGLNGTMARFTCPMAGEDRGPIWGTETYTDDSSICTAAVHAGLISYRDGGDVSIQIMPGLDNYDGSSRNGVESLDFASWSGSYRFVEGGSQPPGARIDLNPGIAVGRDPENSLTRHLSLEPFEIGWKTNALELRSLIGFRATVMCPSDGTAGAVWGTNVYTTSSSICTAAVHSGIITFREGGTVTFELTRVAGWSYEGTERNGVTSRFSPNTMDGGFRFVELSDTDGGG